MKLKPIEEQVVVITGATSGIGLATALLAARRRAKVVLVAPDREALDDVEARIARAGGTAFGIVADVADEGQVNRAAEEAKRRFGRIDTWVNNAGIGIFGLLTDVDGAEHRRLFDVNFWGVVHGSRAAVRAMRQGGALINLGSAVSDRAFPIQGMYSASKHAIKGFTDALRVELMSEHVPISVTLVKPGAVATPFVQNATNRLEREAKLPPPLYRPEEVAEAILHAATHPVRDIYVGAAAKMISLSQMAPRLTDWISLKTMYAAQTRPRHKSDRLSSGPVHGRTRGRHPGQIAVPSLYTRAALAPSGTRLLAAGLGVAALVVMAGTRRATRL